MSPTRRMFVRNAALSAIAARFLPAAFASDRSGDRNETFSEENLVPLISASMKTFEPWIGSRFQISLNRNPKGSLVLVSVEDLSAKAREELNSAGDFHRIGPAPLPGDESSVSSFALHFRGSGTALPQETYLLSHDWLGTFPLLLVPSGLSTRRPTCTAVFTLIDKQAGLKRLQ